MGCGLDFLQAYFHYLWQFITDGVIIVYWEKGSLKGFGIHQSFVIGYAVVMALSGVLDKYLVDHYFDKVASYQVVAILASSIFMGIIVPSSVKKVKPLLRPNKSNFIIVLSAILFILSVFAYLSSFKFGGQVSQTAPIWYSSVIFSVLMGILFLRERENIVKKISGSLVVFVGIILIWSVM